MGRKDTAISSALAVHSFFLTVTLALLHYLSALLHYLSLTYRHTPPPHCLPLVTLSLSVRYGVPKPSICMLSSLTLPQSQVSEKHIMLASLYSVIKRTLAFSSSKLKLGALGRIDRTFDKIIEGSGGGGGGLLPFQSPS